MDYYIIGFTKLAVLAVSPAISILVYKNRLKINYTYYKLYILFIYFIFYSHLSLSRYISKYK